MSFASRYSAADAAVNEIIQDGNRLGDVQRHVLVALLRHGQWPGGWVWDTDSGTRRVLVSLVRRGFVQPHTDTTGPRPYTIYTPAPDVADRFELYLTRYGAKQS